MLLTVSRRAAPTSPPYALDDLERTPFEDVVVHRDPGSGLHAILAIHDTRRGPALGGVRMWPYSTLDEAMRDALRLARAMTYKAAVSNLALGGGKAVIIGDPARDKSPALLRAFARAVDRLGGRYITAEDVGMTVRDMEHIRHVTPFVAGTSISRGGSGDPSVMTALGVFHGIRAVLRRLGPAGRPRDLTGVVVAIQGVGKVGARLAALLHASGARVVVSDLDLRRARRVARTCAAEVVGPRAILGVPCDVFAPCALGGVLNAQTIPRLQCRAVAGAANNQLATPEDAHRLERRGILYAPDFVINAGGLINIAVGFQPRGYDVRRAERRTRGIDRTLTKVFEMARVRRLTPADAAVRLAESRLRGGRRWLGPAQ